MPRINEASIDVIANRVLGYRSFDTTSMPTEEVQNVLSNADRRNLRKLVKIAIRETLRESENI